MLVQSKTKNKVRMVTAFLKGTVPRLQTLRTGLCCSGLSEHWMMATQKQPGCRFHFLDNRPDFSLHHVGCMPVSAPAALLRSCLGEAGTWVWGSVPRVLYGEFISQEMQLEIRHICFPCSLWALGCFYVSREINRRIWVLQIRHVLGIKPPHCAPGQVLGHGVLCEGRGAGGGRMRDPITATSVLQLLS